MAISEMIKINKKIKKVRKKNPNTGIKSFLFVCTIGYLFFFTSKFWMPEKNEFIESTPLYQTIHLNEYDIYLTQLIYSGKDNAIQIILEKENKGVMEHKFTYSAEERKYGKMNIVPVYEEPDFSILLINNIPLKWKELSIRVKEEGKGQEIKFYTNVNSVKRVDSIERKTNIEYKILRLETQIDADDMKISKKNKNIQKLLKENEKIQDRINNIGAQAYPTEVELKAAENLIEKAKSQIQLNLETIEDEKKEIQMLMERNKNIEEQIYLLKEGKEE